MSRALAPAVVALVTSGCLPDLPAPADGGDDETSDGMTITDGVSDGMTVGATETNGGTETTGDDDDDSDETETETGTTGEPGGCGAIDPFEIDGHAATNCRIGVDFDLATARTLTELRTPQGSDENLLFSGSASFFEEYAGVIQWPLYSSMSSTEPRTELGAHFVAQQGPAVFRIWIPWIVDAGAGAGVEGRSIYTVLADGRIFRDESVHVFEDNGDWLVAYLALRSDALPTAYWGGAQNGSFEAPVPGNGDQISFYEADSEPSPDNDAYTCAHDSESGDTVGFAQYEGTYTTWAGPRATFLQEIAGKTQTSAFVLQADWVREMSIALTDFTGEIMMYAGADTSRAPCAAMADYYAAYRDPGSLLVTAGGNADLPELIGNEGEADDDFAHGSGFYYLQATGSDDIVLSIEGGATQPTVLLYVADLASTEVTGVSVAGEALSSSEYIVQVANEESGGTSMSGLDAGAFILIGVVVEPGAEITISR